MSCFGSANLPDSFFPSAAPDLDTTLSGSFEIRSSPDAGAGGRPPPGAPPDAGAGGRPPPGAPPDAGAGGRAHVLSFLAFVWSWVGDSPGFVVAGFMPGGARLPLLTDDLSLASVARGDDFVTCSAAWPLRTVTPGSGPGLEEVPAGLVAKRAASFEETRAESAFVPFDGGGDVWLGADSLGSLRCMPGGGLAGPR